LVLTWIYASKDRTDSKIFIVSYGCIAYYFSSKMVRLVILMGPIGSVLGAVTIVLWINWAMKQIQKLYQEGLEQGKGDTSSGDAPLPSPGKGSLLSNKERKRLLKKKKLASSSNLKELEEMMKPMSLFLKSEQGDQTKKIGSVVLVLFLLFQAIVFWKYCQRMAVGMSQPSIMFQAKLRDGSTIIVDDYREAYWWLRDTTAKDSRVMAWWDYGYQINGIAERTSIADGNTWNHEHIATLGRCLTSPEKRAHKIVRHLADYVLVWAGGGGDDLAKSPHMARIGNSVYSDICPGDPTCSKFGFDRNKKPTPMMAASLLYKLHTGTQDQNLFEHVFDSKYGKVRIYRVKRVSRKSKAWISSSENLICDAPGSWYCVGQYPPALNKLMLKKEAFTQVSSFVCL
jgi:dolichyl-diphosphooligosaccharide--protein glycosyltransferase